MTAQQLLNDQRHLFRDLPTEPLTVGALTVPCLVVDDRESSDWMNGGLDEKPRATVIVERSTMPEPPKRGALANYRGISWRIAEVIRNHANTPLRLNLESLTQ